MGAKADQVYYDFLLPFKMVYTLVFINLATAHQSIESHLHCKHERFNNTDC